jgi:Spy/CpxP family protein refolding chaperone
LVAVHPFIFGRYLISQVPFFLTIKTIIMKKFLFLSLIFTAVITTTTNAQAGDPPSMLQQMKDRTVPKMVEKTGLTTALAEKVIELNYEMRMAAGALPNDADRSKKIADLKAAKEKKMSELLTPEQLKAVATFYEDMAKNAPPKGGK